MLPYGRQDIEQADVDAVVAALQSDWLTTGPEVARFEAAISKVAGGASATAVTSGTAALHTAYAAANLAPGDEVVSTPMTFVATQSTACAFGAKIVFADIDPFTGNLDPEAAAAAVTEKTKVIATVDYAGHPVKGPEFQKLAAESGALFLEDAAHSIGSTLNGVPVGQLADLTTFSFFPTKNLTTAEGGAVVTTSAELDKRARNFKGLGMIRDPKEMRAQDEGSWFYEVQEFGLNYRLPDVLCALGTSQIARLGQYKARRQEIHDRYNAAFAGNESLTLPGVEQGAEPMWHLYPLRVPAERRRAIFDELRTRGIGVQVNYIPSYWHPVFQDMGYKKGMCPNAEQFYAQEISLPLFATLTNDQVDMVIENVLEIVGE
ncbi:aminotransferase class V-fold PLP-dependent enzyme [Pseudarthrobacter sp. J1763]|uniref:aminotransferase class V-fold PLP-dependent enzyme n=1 Tax=Pseudarthrobacter sp. J1763 TaxID=3420445 RepID=UPI003D2E8A82